MESRDREQALDTGPLDVSGDSRPLHAWCLRSSEADAVWHNEGFETIAHRYRGDEGQDPVERLLQHEALLGLHHQAIADQSAHDCRLVFNRDGRLSALEATVSPGRAPGQPDCFTVTTLREVGRELEVEAALYAERRLRLTIFESIPDAAVMVNAAGTIVFANTAAIRLFGHSRLEGMSVDALIPEAYRSGHDALMTRYLAAPEARHKGLQRPLRALHADGSTFPVEIGLCPFRRGDTLEVIAMIRDVRERLELERQVRQTQRLEAVSTLASGLAHDFNNLLGIMLGEMDRMSQQDSLQEVRRGAARAVRAGATAASICQRLLRISGSGAESETRIDLSSLIRSWVAVMEDAFSPDVTFRLDVAAEIGDLHADPWALENALLNLCRNAREAMPDGGCIDIDVHPCDPPDDIPGSHTRHWIAIRVQDQGAGIPPDVRERIFDAFYTTKSRRAGHGLGLAMVNAFARQAGGKIEVEATGSQGTRMLLRLPLNLPQDDGGPP